MSQPKELHFFNLLQLKDHLNYNSSDLGWYLSFFNPKLKLGKENLFRYLMFKLKFKQVKVFGEATASYAVLEEDVIRSIKYINPNMKIIMTVRHPIDRAWSHAKKDLMRDKNRNLEDIEKREIVEFLEDDYQLKCGSYRKNIETWKRFIPDENILVLKFSDIANCTEKYIMEVFNFLGIDKYKDLSFDSLDSDKVNPTEKIDVPDYVKKILLKKFEQEIAYWEERNFFTGP